MLPLGYYRSKWHILLSGAIWGHGDVQAKTTAGAVSGSVDLLQSESLLVSMVPIAIRVLWIPREWDATWGHDGVQEPSCH